MYKRAEEEINKGLSPIARFILGSISSLFGGVMFLIQPPNEKALLISYAFGIFCFLIGIACFTRGKTRQFVGSTIGCALLILSGLYLYSQLTGGPFLTNERSEPSVVNAIAFFFAFGIPGLTYALKARFGFGKNKSEQKP